MMEIVVAMQRLRARPRPIQHSLVQHVGNDDPAIPRQRFNDVIDRCARRRCDDRTRACGQGGQFLTASVGVCGSVSLRFRWKPPSVKNDIYRGFLDNDQGHGR